MSDSLAGVVLCGGGSSRMRRPKALLPWRGQPLIAHMVERLGQLTNEVVVVSRQDLDLPELRATVVVDRVPDLGPLGGIREGLHAIEAEHGLFTSTDCPNVDAAFVRELAAAGRTVACEADGFIQPFPAVYARELAPTADALIESGRLRPLDLLKAGQFECMDGTAWAKRGTFAGFNTPAEYIDAVKADVARPRVVLELHDAARAAVGQAEVETDAGTLREVLGALEPEWMACRNESLLPHVRILLNGEMTVNHLACPIGPGERVVVRDSDV